MDIKDCPVCGDNRVYVLLSGRDYMVRCIRCLTSSDEKKNQTDAMISWNDKVARIEYCSRCTYRDGCADFGIMTDCADSRIPDNCPSCGFSLEKREDKSVYCGDCGYKE